jgi:hypothetical protein
VEKLTLMPIFYRFVTGHDLSRADKANRTLWASAPAELVLRFHSVTALFSAACNAPFRTVLESLNQRRTLSCGKLMSGPHCPINRHLHHPAVGKQAHQISRQRLCILAGIPVSHSRA